MNLAEFDRFIFAIKASIYCLALATAPAWASSRDRELPTATVTVQAGVAGCQVDMDSGAAKPTNAAGKVTFTGVDPGDRYVHVRCPGNPESVFFISPKVKEVVNIQPTPTASSAAAIEPSVMAQNQLQLRKLVQQALQLRAQAKLDDAVAALRQAMQLDPQNSDLHRELGITYLLAKDWKPARVEMLEAIRHDQTDADAHNGLGYALEKLGDLDAAVKEYRLASNLEPDDSTYRTHYLDALVKIQARKQANKQ